jgi:hypothetical protein
MHTDGMAGVIGNTWPDWNGTDEEIREHVAEVEAEIEPDKDNEQT